MRAMTANATSTPPQETGATVADARLLARKALQVAMMYRTGPGPADVNCLFLKPAAFLRAIGNKDADQAMPCRMAVHNYILMIGV